MPTQVQFRRGTTGQNNTFTGAEGELTIDTSTWSIRVHDGITAGGHALSGGSSSDLAGGSTGSIPYQIATSSTGFIDIGAADTVLVSDGTTASWVDLGTLTAVGGVNADNLLVNAITAGDRYLVVTDSTGAYTALEASTATLYNDSTGLTLNKTFNAGGSIVPTVNSTYNLGSSSNRFAALYITSSSLYIGETHVTGTGTTGLSVNGIPVALTTENNDLSGRNLTLTGNLTVQGTTVTVDSTVTNVSDPIFTLGTGPSGAAPSSDDNKDRGIAFRWHNGSSAKTGFFGFDDSTGYFTFVPDGTITGEVVSGSTGDFQAANFRGNLVGNVTGDLTGVSSTATNLAGGAAGSIPYQTAAGVTNFVGIGSNGLILTSNGTAPTWTALSGLSAGSATTATNVAGGSAGSLVIQNGDGSTSFVSPGSAGQFLQAGTNTATFVSTSSMYVNSAVNAEKIFGGTAGQLVYQSGVGTTEFAGPGTAGQLLMSAGTGAPTYTNTSSIYVNSSVNAEKWATARTITLGGDLSGSMVLDGSQNVTLTATVAIDTVALGTDTTGIYVAQGATSGFGLSGSASTEGSTFTVTANSTSANTVSTIVYRDASGNFSAGTITATAFSGPITGTATTATNISGGTAGQLAIQSGAGTTAFVPVGTSGQFLQAGTNTATFVSTSSMYVNSAVNAEKWLTARTFTFGGDLTGSMVVNGSQDVTFTATIAANSVALGTDTTGDYVSNGATSGFGLSGSTTGESQTFTVTANSTSANTVSTIVYRDASGNFSAGTITASLTGTATTSTNVAGGAAGQLHIQSGAGTTAFVPVGTSGQFLQAGTTTATFVSTSSMYVNSAVNAEKWITARTFTFGGDLSGSMVVDGSQNVTFTATIAANSVALGTDTTGDYVSNGATSGFGLSGSTTGETQTFTVTANSTSSNTANTIMYRDANGDFAAGGATFSRPVTFSEPVTFSGTATFVYSTNTVYTDNILNVHTPPGGGPTNHVWGTDDGKDIGFIFHYYKSATDRDAFLGFNNSTQFLEWFSNGSEGGGVYTGTTYGTFRTGSIRLQDTTAVNSTNSGALQVAGGVGINGGLFVGGVVTATSFSGSFSGTVTGTASTATNLAGGAAGQIPIQSAAGTTAFIPVGTAGQFLQAGTNTATFVSTSSMYVNSAVNAEKIFGGTAGQLVYQSGVGTTSFAGPGTAGQLLMSAGTSAPTYTNTSSIYVNSAVNAEKWLTARTFTFGGDLSGSMVVDGSQNVTFTATIAANSVALGTDTTGDYVSNGATSGFGLSGSTTGETQTFTVTANSTSANTVSTIVYRDASGNFSAGIITATNASITAVTSATTTQTGALIVTGGLGVGNNIVAGGALFVGTPTGTVGAVGEIRATNEITAYYSSDQHLKENIQLISDPIEKLNQIRGVYFDWKDSFIDYRGGEDGYFVRKHDVGVIAQEVAKVLPEVVAHKSDGYMGVKYEKIIPLLIEAIKDQQRQITQLSEQVNKLVNK